MDDTPEVIYKNGDIVWVKLGLSWWPGQVTPKETLAPEIINLKKPPLVVVKFFDEDNYEFVKNWNTIYPYNSEKKNDFIKKGMAGFRSKAAHMEKFPKDVLKAETLVGGNPDILSDPMFLPEKKVSYVAEIFGTSTPKGKAKDKKPRPSKSQEDTSYITHRRFLGQDDYKAVYLIQYPGKDRNEEDNEEIIRLNRQPEEEITCNNCSFSTTRMDVMVLHTKSHVRQGKHMVTLKKKQKKKRPKVKKHTSDDELSDVPKKKKKRGRQPKKAQNASTSEEQGTSNADLRTNLLAEWADSGEESDENEKSGDKDDTITSAADSNADNMESFDTEMDSSIWNTTNASRSDDKNEDKIVSPVNVEEETDKVEEKTEKTEVPVIEDDKVEPPINENQTDDKTEPPPPPPPPPPPEAQIESKEPEETVDAAPTHQAAKSCFDFDEDEEDHPIIPTASTGRKIPRVIPLTERRKTDELNEDDDAKNATAETDIVKDKVVETPTQTETKSSNDIEEAFQELMEMTAVPELPDIQNSLKCEQNFHSVPTIKFPDKPEIPDNSSPGIDKAEKHESETATKLTNPKKRFVKSFEDFEKEVRRKEELEDLAKKQESVEKERSSEEDKVESAVEAPRETIENEEDAPTCSPAVAKDITTLARLKSKIMSKMMDESNSNKETKEKIPPRMKSSRKRSKKNKPKVHVSDDSSGDEKETTLDNTEANLNVDEAIRSPPTKSKNTHKTPRSKILESYRNEQEKLTDDHEPKEGPPDQSPAMAVEEHAQEIAEEPKREVLPPKKSKWSRRTSHSKKDRILNMTSESTSNQIVEASEDVKQNTLPLSEEESKAKTEIQSDVQPSDFQKEIPESILDKSLTHGILSEDATTTEREQENVTTNVESSAVIEDGQISYEEYNVDSFSLSNKEEFSPVEKASVFLPEDAICSPPRQSKKRKNVDNLSEEEDSELTEESKPLMKHRKISTEDKINIDDDPKPEFPVDIVKPAEDTSTPEQTEEQKSNHEVNIPETVKLSSNEAMSEEYDNVSTERIPPTIENIFEDKETFNSTSKDLFDVENKAEQSERVVTDSDLVIEESKEVVCSHQEDVVMEEIIDVGYEEKFYDNNDKKEFKTDNDTFDHVGVDIQSDDKAIGTTLAETEMTVENPNDNTDEITENRSVSAENPAEEDMSKPNDQQSETDSSQEEASSDPKIEFELEKQPECIDVCEEVVYDDKHVQDQFETQKYVEEKVHQDEENKEDNTTPVNPEVTDQFVDQSDIELEYPVSDSFNIINQQEVSMLTPLRDQHPHDPAAITPTKEPLPGELVLYPEPELVPIEGNLTVVSEKDLADGQVEITSEQVISSKKNMLSNFSLDFSDSTNDSTSTGDTLNELPEHKVARDAEKAKLGLKKGNTYDRFELLDILEGNTKAEKKVSEPPPLVKSIVDDFCDFEDHIPSQIVCAKKLKQDKEDADKREEALKLESKKSKGKQKSTIQSTTSKLLQRLTDGGKKSENDKAVKDSPPKGKSGSKGKAVVKPIILTDQAFKIQSELKKTVASKKLLNDVEDMKTFVIQKDVKKVKPDEIVTQDPKRVPDPKSKLGKAKILQQTIITPAGEIIQPETAILHTDDNIFDINSMPIVLSDQILTPESIENIPIVISGKSISQEKPLASTDNKAPRKFITKISTTNPPALVSPTTPNRTIVSPAVIPKLTKPAPRILQMGTSKAVRQTTPVSAGTSTVGKYILVQQGTDLSTVAKGVARKVSGKGAIPTSPELGSKPAAASGLVGNKVMILTNEQGEQKRVLLTPEHQKLIGYQSPRTKLTKAVVKGNIVTKGAANVGVKSPGMATQKIIFSSSSTAVSSNQQLIGTALPVSRVVKGGVTKKVQSTVQKSPVNVKNQKAIVIKNQVIRKVAGSDEDLEKQVAEQLEAIRASSGMKVSSQPKFEEAKSVMKTPAKRSYPKKAETKVKGLNEPPSLVKLSNTVSKKPESKAQVQTVVETPKPPLERPLNQLVIQDAVGTQTTITEGQIIALPSETAHDGQPHSYMLVTLDEHGNLTPLNNEALMSLDPNLGGDLNNVVLQIEPSAITSNTVQQPAAMVKTKVREPEPVKSVPSTSVEKKEPPPPIPPAPQTATRSPPVSNANGEPPSQQFIISGDPIATQKFLESLSVGNTDLANILANADGNSILIQADGQQILINTNTTESMLSVNNNNEASESAGNPVFATQPSKNQDILAAALADTDVLQQEQHGSQKLTSQLSPNNALYPMNVGNVLETSLMLSSPIMTPLEVPSTNNKKIPDDEADILTQVPKNVDLPITITDPNISQTVANQQVPPFSTELPTNLELSLPIAESSIAATKEMNSPSFNNYSLPSLDEETVGGMSEKTFGNSMPLLTEDVVEELPVPTKEVEVTDRRYTAKPDDDDEINTDNSFLGEDDDDDDDSDRGRFTLGRQICSSLSEPPPEVFDLSEMNRQYHGGKGKLRGTSDASDNTSKDTDLSTLAESSNDGSLEIPLQARIVARSQNLDAFSSD